MKERKRIRWRERERFITYKSQRYNIFIKESSEVGEKREILRVNRERKRESK